MRARRSKARLKSIKRPSKGASRFFKEEEQAELAALKKEFEREQRRIKTKFGSRKERANEAFRHFKPRRADRGKILFIGPKGGRVPRHTSRKGYAIYVDGKGRKSLVRQRNRLTGRVERMAIPRKLSAIDVTRVRNKRAKRQFLQARLNPIARAALARKGRGISQRGTRYGGKIETTKFYEKADSVEIIAKALVAAVNGTRSKKDFLVTIGIALKDRDGKAHWVELQRRFSRQDKQKVLFEEAQQFLGREVYAFLARELAMRDLVLAGSARHIARLKDNRGQPRDEWRKDGFLWQGHDMQDVEIERIEYRFDQLTLSK